MRRSKCAHFQVESLEGRALLSIAQAPAVGARAVEVRQASGMSNALSNSDVQSLQQVANTNNLVMFLSQLTLAEDNRTGVAPTVGVVLDDARNLDLRLHDLADSKGTVVPADIMGTQATYAARRALSALGTSSFDIVARVALFQAEAALKSQLQQLSTGAQDTDLQALGQDSLPAVQSDLMNMVQLFRSMPIPTGGTPTGSAEPPSSTTLNANDLQTLEHSYSASLMEHFLAQYAALMTHDGNVHAYGEKLVSDHESEDLRIERYARATGTFLPGGIQPQELMTAQRVLRAANTGWADHVYLGVMVQTHTQDIRDNQQVVASTDNPTLKAFAQDDISTDWLHRLGARWVMTHGNGNARNGHGNANDTNYNYNTMTGDYSNFVR